MKPAAHGGGWRAIRYSLRTARQTGGLWRMWRALRSKNACKTCALGMGGQRGGMVNELGKFPEVCKKSIQAMGADLQGGISPETLDQPFATLERLSPRELEHLGRIRQPMLATSLDDRFRIITWEEAIERASRALSKTNPDRSFYYSSGRSSNEAGFLLQLIARLRGTNNVNNCSYFCHQASGVALQSMTGSGTATIQLDDLEHCDLIMVIGANPSSNHPRFMRTLVECRRRGGKVIIINPLREPGLMKFKIPSDVRSMLKASQVADLYLQPTVGGDAMLLTGIMKRLLEIGQHNQSWLDQYAEGWSTWASRVESTPWSDIVEQSGIDQNAIHELANLYAASKHAVFAWAMGLTHHTHGVRTIQILGALAASRGMLGREGAGLLPLRGHSNVQGIGSVGVAPQLKEAFYNALQDTLGLDLPKAPGLDTLGCLEAAHRGEMDAVICLGGNLFGSAPDADFAAAALQRIGTAVHLNTTLNTGLIRARSREMLVLPVCARDEEPQQTTQESMFNLVRFSDGGPLRHEGPRPESDVLLSIAEQVLPADLPLDLSSLRSHQTVREMIADLVPGYDSIRHGDEFQISGRTFHEPSFATDHGRLIIHDVEVPQPAPIGDRQVRVMTVRSEGQFNTVVYEDNDVYRGIPCRDAILLNPDDMALWNICTGERISVSTDAGSMSAVAFAYDVARGCAAMYPPECNIIVPRRIDGKSRTPGFKGFVATLS